MLSKTNTILLIACVYFRLDDVKIELEPILYPEGRAIICRRIEEARYDHPLHVHPEIEVLWMEGSTGKWMIGEALGRFEPGELYILGKNLPHLFAHPSAPSEPGQAELLQFHPDLLEEGIGLSPELAGIRELLDIAEGGLLYRGRDLGAVGRCMREVRVAQGAGRWRAFFALWEEILGLERPEPLAAPAAQLQRAALQHGRIQEVCRYLVEHFHEDIDHLAMAELAHYSPAAFSRRFKQATHKTFSAFLTELRLSHAQMLLRETEWSVLRISMESGFQNLSNFNRRFRQHVGMSPRDYRKQLRV